MTHRPRARFTAWFSLIVGTMMVGQWTVFIAAGQVPELQTEPVRLAFHLAAEAVTAVTLIAAGALLLSRRDRAGRVAYVAHGLLLYTIIVSPGYFAQRGEWLMVAMFAMVLILTLVSLGDLVKAREGWTHHRD